MKNDDVSCVVLGRETRHRDWELITRTLRKSVAFRSAHMLQEQEREALDHRQYQAVVVLAADWDQKRISVIRPPEGFDETMSKEVAEIEASIEASRLINTNMTVTGRMSSTEPNLSNTPKSAAPAPKPEPEPVPAKKKKEKDAPSLIYDEPEL
jgi:hypothetical protein